MKAVMNAVYTTVATGGVAKTVVLANARIDDSNKRITTVETRSSNTCSKVIHVQFRIFEFISCLLCNFKSIFAKILNFEGGVNGR